MPQWHDRAEWLRYSPSGMTGPSQDRSAVRGFVIHYTGGNFDVNGDFERQLAALNESYWKTRGYALGYNWGVDPGNGDVYPIRGSDIRCAANGCQAVNVPYVAVLAPTATVGSQPTEATKLSIKNFLVPELRKIYPQARVHLYGHRDVRPLCGDGGATACPGEPHYALISSGFYDTSGTVPIPTGVDDMAVRIASLDGTAVQKAVEFCWNGVTISALDDQAIASIGQVYKVLTPITGTADGVGRNLTVAQIQKLINTCWAGGAVPAGFTPPAWLTQVATASSQSTAATAAAKLAQSQTDADVKQAELLEAIGDGGSGGGASPTQIEGILNRTVVKNGVPDDKLVVNPV